MIYKSIKHQIWYSKVNKYVLNHVFIIFAKPNQKVYLCIIIGHQESPSNPHTLGIIHSITEQSCNCRIHCGTTNLQNITENSYFFSKLCNYSLQYYFKRFFNIVIDNKVQNSESIAVPPIFKSSLKIVILCKNYAITPTTLLVPPNFKSLLRIVHSITEQSCYCRIHCGTTNLQNIPVSSYFIFFTLESNPVTPIVKTSPKIVIKCEAWNLLL